MELLLIVKALAGTPVTVPSSVPPMVVGAVPSPRVPMHAMRLSVHTHIYTHNNLYTIITDEDNNENGNKQIEELIIQESFACQYKLT